jgi:hypothetical protein
MRRRRLWTFPDAGPTDAPMNDKLSRRDLLEQSAVFGVVVVLGVAACGKERRALSCTDTTGLTPEELTVRTSPAVAYADIAVDPGKPCNRCQHFLPAPTANTCGACKVVKGPINPIGGCKLFVVKPA